MPASPDHNLASLIGRANGLQSWAVTKDRTARTANGRAASDARFARIVDASDPERLMSDRDRVKAIANARQAHYARMAFLSVKSRHLKAAAAALDAIVDASDTADADE